MNEFPIFVDYDSNQAPVGVITLTERGLDLLSMPELGMIIGPQISKGPTENATKLVGFGLFHKDHLKKD